MTPKAVPEHEIVRRCREERERHAAALAAGYAAEVCRLQERLTDGDARPSIYRELAALHARAGNHDQALAVSRQGVVQNPGNVPLVLDLVRLLQECGAAREGIAVVRQSLRRTPDQPALNLARSLLLPALYSSPADLASWRRHFSAGLSHVERLAQRWITEGGQKLEALVAGLVPPFLLATQGEDNLVLQRRFARLAHRALAARCPTLPAPGARSRQGRGVPRIRVGYASARMCRGSVAKVSLGWIRHHDPETFRVYCYHLGLKADDTTAEFAEASAGFVHLSGSLERTCRRILSDKLDVLVLLDVGMDPVMTRLAGLRLAPIQCATWAHPVSSGSPCIDYFLSGELQEPPGSQRHYSEELVRLPNLGTCYPKPVVPRALLTRRRADFALEDGVVLFLCCQPTWKYLPQHDWVFASIAARAPNARFVFTPQNPLIGERLLDRLAVAFSRAGLDSRRFCVLPRRDHGFAEGYVTPFEFWNLCLVCDVLLDTIGWSAGITAFEAAASGLPIVAVLGELARGRQAAALLRRAGVVEAVAESAHELVEIAVRLAGDQEARTAVGRALREGSSRVFDDTACVQGLEQFYSGVVSRARSATVDGESKPGTGSG